MRAQRWWWVVCAALMIGACGAAEPARAQSVEDAGVPAGLVVAADDPVEIERWWGVAGVVLCGLELRLIRTAPVIGMNPYVMAAGLAGCLLALLDVMTTK